MAGRKGYITVSKITGAERARYDHWHRQQQQKRRAAKGFAEVLKEKMDRV